MNSKRLFGLLFVFAFVALPAFGQTTVVVIDPTKPVAQGTIGKAEDDLFYSAIPAVKRQIGSETCSGEVERSGVIRGAFSRAGAKETIVFYQACQTGNGLGWVGLVLIENGKVVGNYVADVGWSVNITKIPDIDRNGTEEFTLTYSGGMHQGQGGTGVDLMTYSGGVLKGLGWFQAEKFDETQASTAWRVTAKPGKIPVYYRQEYLSRDGKNYRRSGKSNQFKLSTVVSDFVMVK